MDSVAESIIGEVGGDESAKVHFKGKIVVVERTLRLGHIYGEVIIDGENSDGKGRFKIPFKKRRIFSLSEKTKTIVKR